ncbi:uncharacterized protein [Procambarus clarkii]|uniref:uncharacterized protein n=1 Tax=Procambarus clarkii TaxID=6728 RepID=UPI00374428F1
MDAYTVSPSKPVVHTSPKTVTPASTIGRRGCLFCQENHTICQCQAFPDRVTRIKRLKELRKCLMQHDPNTCTSPLHICNRCHQDQHSSALCGVDRPKSPKLQVEQDTSTTVQCCKVRQEVKVLNTKSHSNAVLPTAQQQLNNKNSRVTTRGLFDQGSQRTFITQQAASKLTLKPLCNVTLNIAGFLTDTGPQEYKVVQPLVRLGGHVRPVKAIVVDRISFYLNVKGLGKTARFLQKNRIKLANTKIRSDCLTDVGLIVEADYYYQFIIGTTR